uniref:Cdc-73 n=1 Tax=Pristionchus pacificus TaxID=54126 RepID=A0A2A6CS46_PRIPA|eukprot:PDM81025.1 cdc-73 [Pristionchus pacificus]
MVIRSALILLSIVLIIDCYPFSPPCLQYRVNYRLRCMGEESEERLKPGEPSEFARTGYYDRLFRKMNTIGYDNGYWRYPTLGYNANLPADGPYRVYRYGFTMDPLSVLQEYVAGRRSRRDITTDKGSFVIFDDVAYAKDAKTSLFQYGKTSVFYTLESILYLWDNRNLQHAIYVRNASGAGIMAVTRADRREMLEFLKSERTELPTNHDPLAPLSSTIPLSMFADLEGPERKKQKLDPSAMKAPRIDHLLNDGPSMQTQQDAGELRDLNEQLTADKIAALRMKRKNNQRKNITQTLDEGDLAGGDTTMQVDRGDLRDRERVWRTRDNCLEAATKSFASVLTLLNGIKTREEAQARTKSAPSAPSSAPRNDRDAARAAAAARSRTAGYSRYDQEQFTQGEAAEFGVDAAQATFVGTSLNLSRVGGPGAPATPVVKPSTPAVPTPTPRTPVSTVRTSQAISTPDSNKSAKRQSRTPIIIIPAATSSSLITMFNVKDILQDMRFMTTDEKKAAGVKRDAECLIQRRRGDVTVPYRVVDNPMKLTAEEWDRVVGVFAMGPAWQFKGWQWNGNPVDIFSHIAAFHVTYDDMKTDPNIAKWSVTVIQLNRTKRHLDKARIAKFWEVLDKHIVKTNLASSIMSSAPRRSLRLRNSNLPEDDKEEPEVTVKAVAPKRRAAAVNVTEKKKGTVEKAPRKKKKDENEEMDDEDMGDEVDKMDEVDTSGSDEEMEEMKTTKTTKKSVVEKEEAPTTSVVARPKRRCTLAAAKAFRKIANDDGNSDADDDFDIDKEMESVAEKKKKMKNGEKESSTTVEKKVVKNGARKAPAKKKKGKKVDMEDDSTTEDEEEEVEGKEEKPKKKETKKTVSKTSKEPLVMRPPSLDRPSQKVKLLLDREYNVDRDEMVAWEKRAVHMSREYRKIEAESYKNGSGRQKEIMTRVYEFVERCLKDRTHEMGEQESIRQCRILQGEFDEWERKRKMTVTQRIKEKVENEHKKLTAEDSDEKSEEEDEWEAMETVDGEGEVKTMQVHVENKEKNANWQTRWLKQEVNRAMRTRCENAHKAHLLSYMSHLRHLAAMSLSSTSKNGEVPMAAIALSMIPPSKGKKIKKKREKERTEFIVWWWEQFEESERLVQNRSWPNFIDPMYDEEDDERSEEERMSEKIMKRRFTCHKEAAIMFFSLASAAGFTVRIVCRCQVITKKVPEAPDAKKKDEEKGPVKRRNNEKEQTRNHPIIDYWIEMWDEERDTWIAIDVVRPHPNLKNDDDDEEEENEKNLTPRYSEPLNSCMGKGEKVLYMLAIDNEMAIRDVSARYIHSTNFVAKEFRSRRANGEWLNELWEMDLWRAHSTRSRKEDDEWMTSMKVELPKLVGQYKDHPLYVLDKDVLKMQRIFPYNVPSLGELRGYKIYSRMYVRPTNTAKWYEKMGRQVRGRLPRNEFDNIYMYQPKEMCPKGGIYIIPEGLQRVALEHGKDFVQAVIGWTYKGGNIVPIIQGAVFVKEDIPELVAAWKECEKRWKEEEKKIRSEKSLAGWKKLIKGMLRLAAMRKEFEPMENKKKNKGTNMEDEAVRAEEAAAWPQQRYGGDLFE